MQHQGLRSGTGTWVPHDTRDAVVDFVRRWSERAELTASRLVGWREGLPDVSASRPVSSRAGRFLLLAQLHLLQYLTGIRGYPAELLRLASDFACESATEMSEMSIMKGRFRSAGMIGAHAMTGRCEGLVGPRARRARTFTGEFR